MKLRSKFAISIVIVGIIIIVSMSFFYNYYFRKSAIEEEIINAQNIARNYSLQFDNDLKGIINNVITLSSAPVIKKKLLQSNSYYNSLTDHKRKEKINMLNEKWKETDDIKASFIREYMGNSVAKYLKLQQENNPDFYGEIFLTNRYGVMISTTNKLTTLAHSYKYWWRASYNDGEGKIFLDDRGFDTSVKGYVLGVVVPVKDNGQIIGVLKCNINIDNLLFGIIKNYNKLYDYGELKIVRTGGKVVCEEGIPPLTTKVSKDVLECLPERELSRIVTGKNEKNNIIGISTIGLTMGTEEINFGGSYESEDHLEGNRGENWHILVSINSKNILKEYNEKRIVFIYTGIIFIIMTAIFAFLFGDKLSQPIRKVTNIAQNIGKGNLEEKININRDDEIGYLANSFNKMAADLEKTMVSKVRLEKMLQTIQEGYWMVNLNGEIIDVNKAYINMIGYSRQELLRMNITELDLIEDNAKAKNHINRIKEKGHELFETKHKTKNDNIIDVEVSTSFVNAKDPFFITFIRDVTERKEKNRKIKNIKKRLELAVEGANLGIWDWDVQTGYVKFNEKWVNMLGYELDEINNDINSWQDLIHEDDKERVHKLLETHLEGKSSLYRVNYRLKKKKGNYKWILDIAKVIERDEVGNPLRVVGIHQDIDNIKRAEENMKYLSFHDQLTGLYNRRYFEDTIERLNNSRISPIGVITADIDNLKSINDLYGHDVGDEYLKKVAKILSNNVRNEDIVCRIGGDEFAIILPGIKSEIISNIENRIQSDIKKTKIKDFDFSISTGLEIKTDHKQDLEEIINKADQKMYSMKKTTKEADLKRKLSIVKNKEKIVFEEFPMGIVIADFEGNIVEVNNQFCNMLGYSKEELKNMTYFDITKKEDNKINKKYMKKLENKEIESFELDKKYIKKNGEYLDVKLKIKAIKDNYGKPVYDFGVVKEKRS